MNMNYVLGFMFSPDMERVVLIRKTKPEFQKGKLNGVGGKIEENETPIKAMIREFQVETGVSTKESDWIYYGKFSEFINSDAMYSGIAVIHVFKCISSEGENTQSLTEEFVANYKVSHINMLNLASSLNWIIPLMKYEQKLLFDVVFF